MLEIFLVYAVILFGSINLIRMAFFMVGSDLYGLQQAWRKKRKASVYRPFITVVIPAHNEEHTIIRAIDSVLNSSYPENKLQVVVVDDGSKDRTVALVQECLEKPRYKNVELLTQRNAGKAHALNNAMRNLAKGELVMCLDADSALAPDALHNAAPYFVDQRVVALSSNVRIRSTGTLLNLIQRFEFLVCYQMKRAQTFFNIEYIIGGIGSTFRMSALRKVGFYDTDTITEDIDLTLKLLQQGNKDARVIYGSDVITYTESVLSVSGLIRQRFRWKHGRSQTFLKNPHLFFSLHPRHNKFLTWLFLPFAVFSDLAFFLEPLMLGYILYVVVMYQDWVTLLSAFAVVTVYISLNVLAEDTLSWRERAKLLLLAPTMYVFFYLLSFVEYVALIQSYARAREIWNSTGRDGCHWEHVARVPQQPGIVTR